MLTNFGQLNTLMDVDHYAWNSATAANRAKHKGIRFIDQAGVSPTTSATEMAIWNNANDLYYRHSSNGAVQNLTSGGRPVAPFQAYAVLRINTTVPLTILSSFNVTSVVAAADGSFTMNFTTAIPSIVPGVPNYGVLFGAVKGINPLTPVDLGTPVGFGVAKSATQLAIAFSQAGVVFQTEVAATSQIICTVAIFGG